MQQTNQSSSSSTGFSSTIYCCTTKADNPPPPLPPSSDLLPPPPSGKNLLAEEKAAFERATADSADAKHSLQKEVDRLIEEKRQSIAGGAADSRRDLASADSEISRLRHDLSEAKIRLQQVLELSALSLVT